jgi:hypothetical protein
MPPKSLALQPPGGVFPLDFLDCWVHHHGPGRTVHKTSGVPLTYCPLPFARVAQNDVKIDCFCGILRGTKTKLSHALASSPWIPTCRPCPVEQAGLQAPSTGSTSQASFTTSAAETYDDPSSAAATNPGNPALQAPEREGHFLLLQPQHMSAAVMSHE